MSCSFALFFANRSVPLLELSFPYVIPRSSRNRCGCINAARIDSFLLPLGLATLNSWCYTKGAALQSEWQQMRLNLSALIRNHSGHRNFFSSTTPLLPFVCMPSKIKILVIRYDKWIRWHRTGEYKANNTSNAFVSKHTGFDFPSCICVLAFWRIKTNITER